MTSRRWFLVNAVFAWIGVLLSLSLNLSGYYVSSVDPAKPTLLGNTAAGVDTPLERVLDWTTYFTIWSNVVVVVVTTTLVLRPALFGRDDGVGRLWRVLRLDSVLMILITGVLYNLLLANWDKSGPDLISNLFIHVLTPVVTVLVWFVAGPRRLTDVRIASLALVLPLAWAAYALVRGAVVGAYPYPFLDVSTKGYASVLVFVAMVAVVGFLLALAFVFADRAMDRSGSRDRERAAA